MLAWRSLTILIGYFKVWSFYSQQIDYLAIAWWLQSVLVGYLDVVKQIELFDGWYGVLASC